VKDYIEAALSTKGGEFHGQRVGLMYLIAALRDFVDAANHLDQIKKALFYGRKLYNVQENHAWGGVNLDLVKDAIDPDIIHGIIGCATESGEMADALLKALDDMMQGRAFAFDEVNLKEEGGDQLWYLAILFAALDTDFLTEARRNIAKLMLRYPNGFSEQNALVRDLKAERELLETAA
jgi:NTP pyrophosphatase (non-canonical NTP hydrolase)